MESPSLDDPGAKRGCKFGAFGSVGMSMALPKPAGASALGTSAAGQAFKRQRTAHSMRCQDSKGADLVDEPCLNDATSSHSASEDDQWKAEEDTRESRCPLCHQLMSHPLQGQSFQLADGDDSSHRAKHLRRAFGDMTANSHQLVVNGTLMLAVFVGQKALRWMLRKRRRKECAASPTANAVGPQAASAVGSHRLPSEPEGSHAAEKVPVSSEGIPIKAQGCNMQRHESLFPARRRASTREAGTPVSHDKVERYVYQYAALALQQPVGCAKRR